MHLNLFLGTAQSINRVRIEDDWKESDNLIFEGTYGEFSKKIHELDLTKASVLRWEVDGDLVIVGINVY